MALPACVSSGPVATRHGTEAAAEALGGQGFGAWPSVNRHGGGSPHKGCCRGKVRLRKRPHGQRCWFYLFFFFVYIIQCHYRKYGKCQALQGHYVLEAELIRGCQQAFGGIEHPADNQQEHCVYQKLLHRASFFFVILNVFGLQSACRAAAVVAWLVPSSVGIVFAPVPFRAMKQAVFHCHTACFISQYGTFHRQVHRPFNFNICPVRFEDCRFANMHFL